MKSLTRRQLRYICFRIQNEVLGGCKASEDSSGVMAHLDEVKAHMESQEDFGGWEKFGKTWDVDEVSYFVVVTRTSSIHSDWNKTLIAESKPVEDKHYAETVIIPLPEPETAAPVVEEPPSDKKKGKKK